MPLTDPWASDRMAEYAYVRRAENDLHPAVQAAVKEFLEATSQALLGRSVIAAAFDIPPAIAFARDDGPELDGFPGDNVWQRAMDNHIRPVTRRLFDNAYYRIVNARENRQARRDRADSFTTSLGQRLAGFRTAVWERLRRAVGRGREAGETPEQLRARVAELMVLEEWDGQVMTMTRTETMAALNAGAFAGAFDEQERTGEPWEKRWQATDDQRVRHNHRQADGQIRPLHDPFDVGGQPLQFPGDPLGPAGEVINCRCAARYAPASDPSLTAASTSTGEESPMATPTATETPGPVQVSPSGRWRGPLGFMDEWSADQRMLGTPEGGVRSRPMPLPLLVQGALANGHDGGELGVGVIDRIWTDGNAVWGEGRFDMDDPIGVQLARKVGLGFIRFVSLDVDDATARQVLVDAEGNIVEDGDPNDHTLAIGDVYSGWRVMGATLLAHPAFPNAAIALADNDGQALTAAAFAEIVGYNPEWGCVKPAGDGWEAADCEDPEAVPANPQGTAPFDPEEAPASPEGDLAAVPEAPPEEDEPQEPEEPPADIEADETQAAEELDPDADARPGCVTQNDDGTWTPADCETPGAVPANPEGTGPAEQVELAVEPGPPADEDDEGEDDEEGKVAAATHAGVALKALDTGRILLIQRALDDADPAAGHWEFPGGGIETGESAQAAAWREFAEETGVSIPDTANASATWTSPNGVYVGHVATIATEAELGINPDAEDRHVLNPDDPDGDHIEVVAWWNVDDLPGLNCLREECRGTPWNVIREAMSHTAPADCEPCRSVTITAAATGTLAPGWTPPGEWFQPPTGTGGAHSIRVDKTNGRVSGYLAAWGSCHVGYKNRCVPPPHSTTDYAYFNIRPVHTSDGTVYCGLLTMGTGHASLSASANAALAHYDNTGTQAAVVRVGEDNHGIWAVGAALPFLSADDLLRLSLASFSGDWREVRGGAELIAALAVNSPGFPLAAKKTGADNRPYALVAAGALQPDPPPAPTATPLQEFELRGSALDPKEVAAQVIKELDAREIRRERHAFATGKLAALRKDHSARARAAFERRTAAAIRTITAARTRMPSAPATPRPKETKTPPQTKEGSPSRNHVLPLVAHGSPDDPGYRLLHGGVTVQDLFSQEQAELLNEEADRAFYAGMHYGGEYLPLEDPGNYEYEEYGDPDYELEDNETRQIDWRGVSQHLATGESGRWFGDFESSREIRRAANQTLGLNTTDNDPLLGDGDQPHDDSIMTANAMLMGLATSNPVPQELFRGSYIEGASADDVEAALRTESMDFSLVSFTNSQNVADYFADSSLYQQGEASTGVQVMFIAEPGAQGIVGRQFPSGMRAGDAGEQTETEDDYRDLSLTRPREIVTGGRFAVTEVARDGDRITVRIRQEHTFNPVDGSPVQ